MRELTEEVPEAVETKRCPTCLSRLVDGGEKKCPACHARIPTRPRRVAWAENARTAARPLLLVQRELQARIEAQTASNYWQRRRAAKAARRIAALPSALFQNGVVDGVTESWNPQPEHASWTIVDLPPEAIHEVTSVASAGPAAEPVVERPPKAPPIVEVAPRAEPIVAVAPRAEPVVEVAPLAEPIAAVAPLAEPIEVRAPLDPVVERAPTAVAERILEPVPELVLPAMTAWQAPNAAWNDRIFNAARRPRRLESVTWPRPKTPVAPTTDLAEEARS